jgi:hypothetical protein
LYSLIALAEIKFFTPSELDLVICGVPEISADAFRENCEFACRSQSSRVPIVK